MACGQPEPQSNSQSVASNQTKPAKRPAENLGFEPWAFGSEAPGYEKEGGYTSEEESISAQRTALSKVCPKIEERLVKGTVPRRARRCQVTFVGGYIPTELIWSRGTLKSDGGRQFEVVWVWNTLPVGKLDGCASDPVDERPRQWRLTRSSPDRIWQAVPVDRDSTPIRMEEDWVWADCRKMGLAE
jgi:hypothetical protein